jgi:hypothetical protein
MSEWTDERLQRLSIYRGGDEQLRSDIRAALDTISAQFRRAETAEATLSVTEQDRLDAHAAKEKAEAEIPQLRAFAHTEEWTRMRHRRTRLIVHEMRDEKTADAILDAALRGEGA